jgi:hypothetical protein
MNDWRLLRPTREQYEAFGKYIREAHSWYKHLPLMAGTQFAVFVAPDAGVGRLVARQNTVRPDGTLEFSIETPPEGSEFTEDNPRLHYGWQTTKEYRLRFGYLDYGRREEPSGPYYRDAGPSVQLPVELEERCAFRLYPYASEYFVEAVIWDIHSAALEQMRHGSPHPAREQVLELARVAQMIEDQQSQLAEAEQNRTEQQGTEEELLLRLTESTKRRIRALGRQAGTCMDALQALEADKVRQALAELDSWLIGDTRTGNDPT